MSIRLKLTIIFLAIASVPLVLVSMLTYTNFKHSLEANRLVQLNDLCVFRAQRIDAYFAGLKADMSVSQGFYNIQKNLPLLTRLAGRPENPEVIDAQNMLARQLRHMQSVSDMTDIMLLSPQGKVVYSNESRHYLKDFSVGNDAEKAAFANGVKRIFFSNIYFDSTEDKRYEMLVTAPAMDLNNIFCGVIAFEVDMTPVYKLIQDTTGLGATGEVLVGRNMGNQAVFLNPLRHDPKAALKRKTAIGNPSGIPMQQAVQGRTGSGQSIDYRGEPVIAAWRYIPSMGWGLVAKIDTREAFADVTDLKNLVFLILIIVFALCAIMAFSVAQSISRPITALSKGTEIIGGGNLDYKVGTNQKDEIGRLSRAFDKMTHDLKSTTASRDELNREIEGRKAAEAERETSIEFLRLVNNSKGLEELMKSTVAFFKDKSGFEAVGVRLKKGDDYPYFETLGFSEEFVLAEKRLCGLDAEGRPVRDAEGRPVMECLCGKVIQDRADPSMTFFTGRGNFWSNGTSEQLPAFADADRQAHIRNRCNGEGYESVGLFALRAGGGTLGLLQLNDRRRGMFKPQTLALWERLSDYLAVAVSKFMALEALRESEAGLKIAQEISHLGNWELNLLDNRLTWSDEVYRIFGLRPQEFGATYEAFLDAIHPDDRAAVDAAYSGSIREGRNTYEIEHRVVRKGSGEVRIVHEKCEHFRDETGKIVRSVGMVHDITERKKAEEALRALAEDLKRSNRDLEQFAYVASHDLQEPLRAVGGFMGLLKSQYAGKLDATAQEYIGHAVEGAERMQTLIQDLLTFSRVGTRGAIFKTVAMKDAIDGALKNLQAVIAETGAEVTCDAMPEVTADPSQMIQLLQNLVGNALKFHGPRRPEVRIGAEKRENGWEFTVKDNGIGIEPQYFDRIFLIFQRLHTRSQYKGTGIGLAVCKKIVERHGGKIWVESRSGEGSAFHFTIPDTGETV